MTILITDTNLTNEQYSAQDLMVDFACFLYEQRRISMGKASKLAGLNRLEMQKALADRDIYLNYTEEDIDLELRNLGLAG